MKGLELMSFKIISNVGTARSMCIEAVEKARQGKFDEAEELLETASKSYLEGQKVHYDLLKREADGSDERIPLLLIHAEDQLMSAEQFDIIAKMMISSYKEMAELKAKLSLL